MSNALAYEQSPLTAFWQEGGYRLSSSQFLLVLSIHSTKGFEENNVAPALQQLKLSPEETVVTLK